MTDETPLAADLERRRRRLLFRATHRGTHESDLLIGGFVSGRLAQLTLAEIAALEALLETPDPVLADWLTGREAIPPDVETPLLRAMVAACAHPAERNAS
ncbi:MAG: succinate dehydrogenase assembly factor 2 [Acidibrevibacterium sp.]|uniref:FAD assembly factor SdhE n=1 Tax=Acidibrevibacterium sp. TaxID=2606776 RepID=UPI003D08FEC1